MTSKRPARHPASTTTPVIAPGDRVRSFDFPHCRHLDGPLASYAEGVVTGIGRFVELSSCDRYAIRVTKRLFAGVEIPLAQLAANEGSPDGDCYCYPPVNGLRQPGGERMTDGVEKVETADAAPDEQ